MTNAKKLKYIEWDFKRLTRDAECDFFENDNKLYIKCRLRECMIFFKTKKIETFKKCINYIFLHPAELNVRFNQLSFDHVH